MRREQARQERRTREYLRRVLWEGSTALERTSREVYAAARDLHLTLVDPDAELSRPGIINLVEMHLMLRFEKRTPDTARVYRLCVRFLEKGKPLGVQCEGPAQLGSQSTFRFDTSKAVHGLYRFSRWMRECEAILAAQPGHPVPEMF